MSGKQTRDILKLAITHAIFSVIFGAKYRTNEITIAAKSNFGESNIPKKIENDTEMKIITPPFSKIFQEF